MTIKELILKTRSYRRFYQEERISIATLVELVDLARLTASAKNMQPIRYIISNNTLINKKIFSCLSWAGYLSDWNGPKEGEQPSGYIIMLRDNTITKDNYCDHGLAAQSIMLGATEKGYGGCIIAAINKEKLSNFLDIAENLEVLLVLALGRPKETIILDVLQKGESHKYWRDDKGNQHVPKRLIEDIILNQYKQ